MMSASVQRQAPQAQQQQLCGTQVYWVWLARGTMLLATAGRISAARSITAEGAFSEEFSLREGECRGIERSGWFSLRAGAGNSAASIASFICIAPARGENFLRRLIGKWRARPALRGAPVRR